MKINKPRVYMTLSIMVLIILFLYNGWFFIEIWPKTKKLAIERTEQKSTTYNKFTFKSIKKLQPKLDNETCSHIADEIDRLSKEFKISPTLITSLIFIESGFNQMVTSKSGAIGLMQIMYSIWKKSPELKHVKTKYDLYQINHNIRAGIGILISFINKNKGDIEKSLYLYLGKEHKSYYNDIMKTAGKIAIETKGE